MMYGCRNFYFMLDSYPVVSKTRTPNKQTAPLGIGSRCATMHRLENYKACKETGVITEQTPRSEMPLAKPRTKTDRKNTNTLGKQHHSSPKSTYHPHCCASYCEHHHSSFIACTTRGDKTSHGLLPTVLVSPLRAIPYKRLRPLCTISFFPFFFYFFYFLFFLLFCLFVYFPLSLLFYLFRSFGWFRLPGWLVE